MLPFIRSLSFLKQCSQRSSPTLETKQFLGATALAHFNYVYSSSCSFTTDPNDLKIQTDALKDWSDPKSPNRDQNQDIVSALWRRVRKVNVFDPIMPQLEKWRAFNPDQWSKGLLVHLRRKLIHRRHYKHAQELCLWIIESSGWPPSESDYETLMNTFCFAGELEKAEAMFQKFPSEFRTERVFQAVLSCHAREAHPLKVEKSVALLESMGVTLSTIAFNNRLLAYGRAGSLQTMVSILREMKEKNIPRNNQTYNMVMDCYGKEGQLSAMQEAFEAMLADGIEPTSVTYNTLTNSFFRAGEVQKAEDTMDKCRQTIGLAFPSFLTLIWAYSRLGLAEKMEAAIREMQSQKLPIYRQIWMARIYGYGQAGQVNKAQECFNEMVREGREPPVTSTFNCLLAAYALNGRLEEAMAILDEMKASRKWPDSNTFFYLIKGSLLAKKKEWAMQRFLETTKGPPKRLVPGYSVFLELVELFAREGQLAEVRELLEAAERHYSLQASAFNLWLKALVIRKEKDGGDVNQVEVMEILKAMVRADATPDAVSVELFKELQVERLAEGYGFRLEAVEATDDHRQLKQVKILS